MAWFGFGMPEQSRYGNPRYIRSEDEKQCTRDSSSAFLRALPSVKCLELPQNHYCRKKLNRTVASESEQGGATCDLRCQERNHSFNAHPGDRDYLNAMDTADGIVRLNLRY
jgi:hypothetical protein